MVMLCIAILYLPGWAWVLIAGVVALSLIK